MNIVGWPYPITVNGDVEAGAGARIAVDFRTPPSQETFDQVEYAVGTFVALAEAGGLGGDRVQPLRSTASLAPTPSAVKGVTFIWDLTSIAIDARSLAVLFNMLALLGHDLRGVIVEAQGAGPRASFAPDDFPPIWPYVPFVIDDDRAYANVEVQIEFLDEVPMPSRETVTDTVETWLDCGSVQGYRDWSLPADKSFLFPTTDPPFDFADDMLAGHLRDEGVIESCYDILVNVLIRLHATTPVRSLEII